MKGATTTASGTVSGVGRGDLHFVDLREGATVLARRCGRMVKHKIACVVGDQVLI